MSGQRLDFTVGFNADTKALRAGIQEISTSLNALGKTGLTSLNSQIQKASAAAAQLGVSFQKSMNWDTGKLNLNTLATELKANGMTLTQYGQQMSLLGPQGQKAFAQVAEAIATAEMPLTKVNGLLQSFGTTLFNTAKWQLANSVIRTFVGGVQSAYSYTKDLDESLNNIRIVTKNSSAEMAKFAEQANRSAQALSSTTTDYTDAALIYYQQGLKGQDVTDRTDTTIKLANVTGQSAEEVSDQMTAIWNNFYDGSHSLEYYADAITALGASTASSSEEIATGLEKFASVAQTTGLSYEYATSALATVVAKTRQSADTVGTAFKTIFARLQDLEQGEDLDDGTTLGKYSQALEVVGVNIKDAQGNLKDLDTILAETGEKWKTLAEDQKVSLAETVAGTRQYSQFMALMESWDDVVKNAGIAANSSGELQKQADVYAESWEAARDRIRAAAENIYDSLINKDFFIDLDDSVTPFLNEIAKIIDSVGGMKGVISGISALLLTIYGPQAVQGIKNVATATGNILGFENSKIAAMKEEAAVSLANMKTSSAEQNEFNKGLQEEVALINDLQKRRNSLSTEEIAYYETQIKSYNKMRDATQEVIHQNEELKASYEDLKVAALSSVSLKQRQGNSALFGNSNSFQVDSETYYTSGKNAFTFDVNGQAMTMRDMVDPANGAAAAIDNLSTAYENLIAKQNAYGESQRFIQNLTLQIADAKKGYNTITQEEAEQLNKLAQEFGLVKEQVDVTKVEEAGFAAQCEKTAQAISGQLTPKMEECGTALKVLKKVMGMVFTDENMAATLAGSIERVVPSAKKAEIALKNLQAMRDNLANNPPKIKMDFATGIKEASSDLMQLSMAATAFSSTMKSFKAGDLGFTQLASSLAFTLPLLLKGKEVILGAKREYEAMSAVDSSKAAAETALAEAEAARTAATQASTEAEVLNAEATQAEATAAASSTKAAEAKRAASLANTDAMAAEEFARTQNYDAMVAENTEELKATATELRKTAAAKKGIATKTAKIAATDASTAATKREVATTKQEEAAKLEETAAEKEAAAAKAVDTAKTNANTVAHNRNKLAILGAVAALYVLYKAYNYVKKAGERAREAIKTSADAYTEEKEALESLQDELDETAEKIDELQSKDSLSLVEQSDLDKLKTQNKLLEIQVNTQKALTEAKLKSAAASVNNKSEAYDWTLAQTKGMGESAENLYNNSLADTFDQFRDSLTLSDGRFDDETQKGFQAALEAIFSGEKTFDEAIQENLQSRIDAWGANSTQGQNAQRAIKFLQQFEESVQEAQRTDYISKNADNISDLLTQYSNYIASGSNDQAIKDAEENLRDHYRNYLKTAYGENSAGYWNAYAEGVLSDTNRNDLLKQYQQTGSMSLTQEEKDSLLGGLMTEQDYTDYLQYILNAAAQNVHFDDIDDKVEQEFLNNLSGQDLAIAAQITEADSFKEFFQKFLDLKTAEQEGLKFTVDLDSVDTAIDSAQELIEDGKSVTEEVLEQLKASLGDYYDFTGFENKSLIDQAKSLAEIQSNIYREYINQQKSELKSLQSDTATFYAKYANKISKGANTSPYQNILTGYNEETGKNRFGGNVDTYNRKVVSAKEMQQAGWDEFLDTDYATFYSSSSGTENGKEILFTPILPDGEVLDPNTFNKYVGQILDSYNENGQLDDKAKQIVLGIFDSTEEAEVAADMLHNASALEVATDNYIQARNKYDDVLKKYNNNEIDPSDLDTYYSAYYNEMIKYQQQMEDAQQSLMLNSDSVLYDQQQNLLDAEVKYQELKQRWDTFSQEQKESGQYDDIGNMVAQAAREVDIAQDTFEESLESLNAKIQSFDFDPIELEANLKEADAVKTMRKVMDDTASYIDSNYKVSAENVSKLIAANPKLLQGADILSDGALQLKKNVVDTVNATNQLEIDNLTKTTREYLESQKNNLKELLEITSQIEYDYQAVTDSAGNTYDSIETASANAASQQIADTHAVTLDAIAQNNINESNRKLLADAIIKLSTKEKLQQIINQEETTASNRTNLSQEDSDTNVAVTNKGKRYEELYNWMLEQGQLTYEKLKEAEAQWAAGNDIASTGTVIGFNSSVGSVSYTPVESEEPSTRSQAAQALLAYFNGQTLTQSQKDALQADYNQSNLGEYGGEGTESVLSTLGQIFSNEEDFLNAVLNGTSWEKYSTTDGVFNDRGLALRGIEISDDAAGNLGDIYQGLYDLLGDQSKNKNSKSGSSDSYTNTKDHEEKERYQEINALIDEQSDKLDEVDEQLDRAYGVDKLDKFQEKQDAILKDMDLQNQKLQLAKQYLDEDTEAAEKYFNETAKAYTDKTFDKDNVENMYKIQEDITDKYNEAIDEYNDVINGSDDTKKNAAKEKVDTLKKALDQWKQYVSDIEESRENIRAQEAAVIDDARKAWDNNLDRTNTKLEIVIDTKDAQKDLNDFLKEINESVGDALDYSINSLAKDYANAEIENSKYNDYYSHYQDLLHLMDDSGVDMDTLADEFTDLQGDIISSGEALLDFIDTVENSLGEALDAADERFQKFIDTLEHNSTLGSSIAELMKLQGVTNSTAAGLAKLKNALTSQMASASAQAQYYYNKYIDLQDNIAAEQALLDQQVEGTAAYDAAKANLEKLQEESDEAQENWLAQAKEALEKAGEIYEEELESLGKQFQAALSDGMNLDWTADSLEHLIDLNDEYYDAVEETYQTEMWNNKLQKDIDNATSNTQAAKLKALKDEIELRKQGNGLSEYDMEILEKKYALLQAEMALEDAQNNKSTMRLTRDAQGNYRYTYTADQDAIADAQDDVLKAQDEYYTTAKAKVEELAKDIIDTEKEAEEAIADIYTQAKEEGWTSDQIKTAVDEAKNYYTTEINNLKDEFSIAAADMSDAGQEAIDDYDEKYVSDLEDMIGYTNDFATEFEDYIDECGDAYEEYAETVEDASADMDVSLSDLNDILDDVDESTEDLMDAVSDHVDEIYDDELDAVQAEIDKYTELLDTLKAAADAYSDLATEINGTSTTIAEDTASKPGLNEDYDVSTDTGTVTTNNNNSTGSNSNTQDWSHQAAIAAHNGWWSDAYEDLENRDAKLNGSAPPNGVPTSFMEQVIDKAKGGNTKAQDLLAQIVDMGAYQDGWSTIYREWKNKLDSMDTGGYTGNWNSSDGKLAMLHQKELVLNSEDTENILSAVDMIRTLSSADFGSMAKQLNSEGGLAAAMAAAFQAIAPTIKQVASELLSQDVHIEASFPGVSVASEIEAAFNDLVNQAAQFASTKF